MPEIITIGEFREKRKTGEEIEFVIQTIPTELTEDVIKLMTKFFIPREPTSIKKFLHDEEATKHMQNLWRKAMSEGTTLIALLKENGQITKLIGANVTGVEPKNRPAPQKTNNANFDEVSEAVTCIAKRGHLFDKYGIESYLTAYGLTVDADYHGFKVGYRLLESRRPLCKRLGIKATGTFFSVPVTQKLGKDLGFDVLYEEEYKNFEVNGKKPFESLPGKLQMMGLKF